MPRNVAGARAGGSFHDCPERLGATRIKEKSELRKRLLIATRNAGKLREFRRLLADLDVEILGLEDVGVTDEVDETGETFEENARLKAETYARLSGLLTLADDSGLEVDALGGRPGVRSARYGGPGLTDLDRVQKLLDELRDVRGWDRGARFRAVVALAGEAVDGGVATADGVAEGAITHEPIGEGGFGYDPVFWIAALASTTAQLTGAQKDSLSHRGDAVRKIVPALRKALGFN